MSKIKAGTTSGTALVTEGDTTGQLVFQTNGTTTALTLGTDQSATFVGNVAVNGTLTASGGLPSLASPLTVTGNSTAGAEIRLPEDTDNGSNYVALKAPDTLASNLTLTLPSADGTNGQVLQTNGSGALSFTSLSSDFVLIATNTVSSDVLNWDITTPFTNTYKSFFVVIENLNRTGPTSQNFNMRIFRGGTIDTSSNYNYVYDNFNSAGGGNGSSTDSIILNQGGLPTNGYFYILNAFPSAPSNLAIMGQLVSTGASNAVPYCAAYAAFNTSSGSFSGIRIYNNDTTWGRVGAGTKAYIYGMK